MKRQTMHLQLVFTSLEEDENAKLTTKPTKIYVKWILSNAYWLKSGNNAQDIEL